MESATSTSNQLISVPLTSLALHNSENSFEIHLVRGHEIVYQVINSSGDFGFVLKVPNNYRSMELNMFGTIWNAIKTYARKQNEFSLKGIDVSLVEIHEHDHNWSMLPFLDVLSNTVSGPSERVIIMKVKQGHSELRLVAQT